MAADTIPPQVPDQGHLGHATPGWKTTVTKVIAATGFAVSAATVGLGAYSMIKRHDIAPEFLENYKKISENSPFKSLAEVENSLGKTGAVMTGIGIAGGIASAATWESASSASRARNYLKLSEQLNGSPAQGR